MSDGNAGASGAPAIAGPGSGGGNAGPTPVESAAPVERAARVESGDGVGPAARVESGDRVDPAV
ncbi:MAG: hypothetical protein P8181_16810, partial [bacterium]